MSLMGTNPQKTVNIRKSDTTQESGHCCIEILEEIEEDLSPCQIYCLLWALLIAYFMPYILIMFITNAYSQLPIKQFQQQYLTNISLPVRSFKSTFVLCIYAYCPLVKRTALCKFPPLQCVNRIPPPPLTLSNQCMRATSPIC